MPRLIAVISDTHGHIPPDLPERLRTADEIWHLGDVTSPETIEPLEALGIPMAIVEGNCDIPGFWPTKLLLDRNGSVFQLQHRPPRQLTAKVDAILFGHLHCPINETEGQVRLLNPGAISGPRQGSQPSFAWLKIQDNGCWTWEIETI